MTLTATERIEPGEQIFVRYSTRPSAAQLALDYGVLPPTSVESGTSALHIAVLPIERIALSPLQADVLDTIGAYPQ